MCIRDRSDDFTRMCGTIWRTLENKCRKETKIKFYKTIAILTLMNGCETYVLKEKYKLKVQQNSKYEEQK